MERLNGVPLTDLAAIRSITSKVGVLVLYTARALHLKAPL